MAITNKIIFISILLFLVHCSKADFNPKLVEYLKAERELKKNILPQQGLDDSLICLQKRFKIDVNKELKKIQNNPESWIKLLKAIDGEK